MHALITCRLLQISHAVCPLSHVTRVTSLPLFDWRTLAVIQAFACLAISCFVNLALLESPELYGLHPDGVVANSASQQTGHNAANSATEGAELQDVAQGSCAGECDSTLIGGSEQASGIRRRSGEEGDAVPAISDESCASGSGAGVAIELEGLTVRQALRRPIFWLILLSIFFIDVLWGGFNLHFISVLEDQGLGRTSGASTFLATSVAAALSSLLCGPFFDRLPVGLKVRNLSLSKLHSINSSYYVWPFVNRTSA